MTLSKHGIPTLYGQSPHPNARSILIWDTRAGPTPMGWLSGVDISGDSLDISRDGNTLLVGAGDAFGGTATVVTIVFLVVVSLAQVVLL